MTSSHWLWIGCSSHAVLAACASMVSKFDPPCLDEDCRRSKLESLDRQDLLLGRTPDWAPETIEGKLE